MKKEKKKNKEKKISAISYYLAVHFFIFFHVSVSAWMYVCVQYLQKPLGSPRTRGQTVIQSLQGLSLTAQTPQPGIFTPAQYELASDNPPMLISEWFPPLSVRFTFCCIGVLFPCMSVHHKPEEGIRYPRTRVIDSCEPSCSCRELKPRLSTKPLSPLNCRALSPTPAHLFFIPSLNSICSM